MNSVFKGGGGLLAAFCVILVGADEHWWMGDLGIGGGYGIIFSA